jgi:hypothetical protein
MDWPVIRLHVAIGLLQCGTGALFLAFLTLAFGGAAQYAASLWTCGAGILMIATGMLLVRISIE